MKRFHCVCGQEILFEDSECSACGRLLGFSPETKEMLAVLPSKVAHGWVDRKRVRMRACGLRDHPVGCNWLINKHDPHEQCCSCRLTRTIPQQNIPLNVRRWTVLERAKRRLIYSLLMLGLPIVDRVQNPSFGLAFDFLEDQRSNPLVKKEFVYTGHHNGVITINVVEADDTYRVSARERMNERYRTVLGHFRHESGHYYWDKMIKNSAFYPRFRYLFGSEANYRQALDAYYVYGPAQDWQKRHISAYASSHAWEDWAETWAHYLHIMDTLETATGFGVIRHIKGISGFGLLMSEWWQLKVLMNSLNRSMGLLDAYPFTLTKQVIVKLRFIHQVIAESNTV
ncbi:MAG: hypothetical protein RI964_253 [Pseudomonadota bacterium]|jgi:hypothetical protein